MSGDQRAAWKRAIAEHAKQQRNQRGRFGGGATPKVRPGMIRVPAAPCDDDRVSRCTVKGCPSRFNDDRGDRPCRDHQDMPLPMDTQSSEPVTDR